MACLYYSPGTTVVYRYKDPRLQKVMELAEKNQTARLTKEAKEQLKAAEAELKDQQQRLDRLTHHGCLLREYFLKQVRKNSAYRTKVNQAQIEHRQMDLERLEDTLNSKLKRARSQPQHEQMLKQLWLVQHASPLLPLEPQIGFDPDGI